MVLLSSVVQTDCLHINIELDLHYSWQNIHILPPSFNNQVFGFKLRCLSGREPMAREPDVALFKTASDSLSRRQAVTDFLQCIAK